MALTKGMYSLRRRSRRPSGRFGLREAQLSPRIDTAVRNAGWYNGAGEKLGWGDLSHADLLRIAGGLKRSEIFVVLEQDASHFAFLFPKRFAWAKPNGRPDVPGRGYVARHARFAIVKDRVCVIDRRGDIPKRGYVRGGVRITPIGEEELAGLMRR